MMEHNFLSYSENTNPKSVRMLGPIYQSYIPLAEAEWGLTLF